MWTCDPRTGKVPHRHARPCQFPAPKGATLRQRIQDHTRQGSRALRSRHRHRTYSDEEHQRRRTTRFGSKQGRQLYLGTMLRPSPLLFLDNPSNTYMATVAIFRQVQFTNQHRLRRSILLSREANELGFADGLRTNGVQLEDYDRVTKKIKALIESDEDFCKWCLRHPDEPDLSFLCESSGLRFDDASDFWYRFCYGCRSSSCSRRPPRLHPGRNWPLLLRRSVSQRDESEFIY